MSDEIEHAHNQESDSFDDEYNENPKLFGHPYIELQNYFNSNCPTRGNLLDLGCGQGRDSIFLASLGYKVTAVDSSKIGIQQLLNEADSQEVKIDGIVSDIQDFKTEKRFDVILFDMVLHGFKKSTQLEMLDKYSNLLNKEGILCIVYPDDFSVEHFMEMLESTSSNWKLLDEITVNDVPKVKGETIDFKFKMMVAKLCLDS
ncbi:MAG: class I SAM-dependent methyltransferase [Nitrosopumilus sp.]